jgi:hypothetical protein
MFGLSYLENQIDHPLPFDTSPICCRSIMSELISISLFFSSLFPLKTIFFDFILLNFNFFSKTVHLMEITHVFSLSIDEFLNNLIHYFMTCFEQSP